jgi:hypothetical protein
MLGYRLPDRSLPLWLVLAGVAGLLVIGRKQQLWTKLNYGQAPLLLSVGLAFVGFFVLQGILAHHSMGYVDLPRFRGRLMIWDHST